MGGGFEHFLRMHYYIFTRATIWVTTHATIMLWEFCTISNALLLSPHHYIGYCMPYYTIPVKEVHICMIFNALLSFFFLNKYINIFLKKLMVTCWKIDKYLLILLKIHRKTFSNPSGNLLRVITNNNGATFP